LLAVLAAVAELMVAAVAALVVLELQQVFLLFQVQQLL
jgi:hypothetical protein